MNQPLPEAFSYCPKCGVVSEIRGANPFECKSCGFRFFFGPTAAVAAIVTDAEERVLFLKRARDPGRGMLGLPGGFVDAGESVEEALIREVYEETNLKVASFTYIGSYPNKYAYRGLLYSVSDVFFRCYIESMDALKTDPSEVEEYYFLHPTKNELSQLAFPSNRSAVEKFLEPRPKSNDVR